MRPRKTNEAGFPTALTVIKAIAAARGVLPSGEAYLTKYQMIALCERWLEERRKRRPAPSTEDGG